MHFHDQVEAYLKGPRGRGLPESIRQRLRALSPVDVGLDNVTITDERLDELRALLVGIQSHQRARMLVHCDVRSTRAALCELTVWDDVGDACA